MIYRKTILSIVFCFICSVLVIVVLKWISVGQNNKKNHFIRVFPPHFLVTEKSVKLDNPDFYIAGVTSDFIYLANYYDPGRLFRTDWGLIKNVNFKFKYGMKDEFPLSSLKMSIDSPYIFINNYTNGSVFQCLLSKFEDSMIEMPYFKIFTSAFIPYAPGRFAIRTFDTSLKENVVGRLTPDSPFVKRWPNILVKQDEGIFSTDGMLRYDFHTGRFIYTYFYRNQFICFDSSFNIIYTGKTIDTNSIAKIKVQEIDNQKSTSIASPNFRVNRAVCLNSHWIFINSDLLADNEDRKVLNTFTVIDVYNLEGGRYQFSFYLPKDTGRITDLAIQENTLVAIQGRSLVLYPLNLNLIKN